MSAADVIAGKAVFSVECADAVAWFNSLPAGAIDLVIGSPPYRLARTYGIDFGLADQAWVDWMVTVFKSALRACKGLVAFVLEGQTQDFRWTAEPALLMADLHRAGVHLRRPIFYHRVGIPGSGGPDWMRGDTEFIVCATNGGRFPWSDNTACGHPPKWNPGGDFSHRMPDGTRVNDPWGKHGRGNHLGGRDRDGKKLIGNGNVEDHVILPNGHETDLFGNEVQPSGDEKNPFGVRTDKPVGLVPTGDKAKNAEKENYRAKKKQRLERGAPKGSVAYRLRTGPDDGEEQLYQPPALANPGNVLWEGYTSQQVVEMLAGNEGGDLLHCNVGGGQMGESRLCHLNEAPYPEAIPEFFVRSFCPPNGVVADCFSGSGTTGAVAVRWNRRFVGCDLRPSQVTLSVKRIETETPLALFKE